MATTSFTTEQEAFWAGEFGDEYTARNDGDALVAANAALFARVLARAGRPSSVIEFGCNRGLNLRALATLLPGARLTGVEINRVAAETVERTLGIPVHTGSILDFDADERHDLALIKGVLIHIHPDELPVVYDKLYASTRRHLLVCEYYNPSPVAIPYRGHSDRLFKRDFAGELLDRFPDLALVDYGFCYHRDPVFPMDDVTWFLLEKKG